MLSRRWLINYALVLLIGLFAFLGFKHDDPEESPQARAIPGLSADLIDSLEIQTADSRFVLGRKQGDWLIEDPFQWPANRFNVDHLLQITEAKTGSQFPAAGKDLAEFGLQHPYALLQLDQTRITFGISHTIGERRYALIDDTVYLLPDVYYPFIQQGVVALIDRRLVPPSLQLQSLKLEHSTLKRDGDRGWQAVDSQSISADWIAQRISSWQGLEASRVTSLKAAAEPLQRVEATLQDGTRLDFQVISTQPELIIANPALGLQFHFTEDQYQQLLAQPDAASS